MTDKIQREHAEKLEQWATSGKEGLPPVLAATVILLRDSAGGIETLMLRRNSKIVFGGMWVFPGGRLDPEDWADVPESDADADILVASRRAAEREAMEECGLAVEANSMVPYSHWTPPPITPKRFLTWFFAARASDGVVEIDDGEIKESQWLTPEEALKRQSEKEIELAPPTFVTLSDLSQFASVEEALAGIGARTPERFETKIGVLEGIGPIAMWHGDDGYEAGDPKLDDRLHRLTMRKGGPWSYNRTA
jgi:8-oxo-dGTP pyrophosphatase MutT (NUDIX family)